MRRITLTAAALGLGLALTACGTDADETAPGAGTSTSTSTAAGDEAAESTSTDVTQAVMDDPACAGFFQTGPVTLADRAQADRDLLEAGAVTDPATWGEVNLLSQRITQLVDAGGEDQAALLERVNAPFLEASAAVLDDDEQLPTDPEITVPEIDVTDSAAAQGELEAACTS